VNGSFSVTRLRVLGEGVIREGGGDLEGFMGDGATEDRRWVVNRGGWCDETLRERRWPHVAEEGCLADGGSSGMKWSGCSLRKKTIVNWASPYEGSLRHRSKLNALNMRTLKNAAC
jgi:hypothetical protein